MWWKSTIIKRTAPRQHVKMAAPLCVSHMTKTEILSELLTGLEYETHYYDADNEPVAVKSAAWSSYEYDEAGNIIINRNYKLNEELAVDADTRFSGMCMMSRDSKSGQDILTRMKIWWNLKMATARSERNTTRTE